MKKLIAPLLLVFALCSPLSAVTVSTTTALVGPQAVIFLRSGETLTYSITGTFTGTALIESSRNMTDWAPVGISTTNNSGGTFSGIIEAGWFSRGYRWNGSTITAGAFVYLMEDNDDLVTEQLNKKKVPVTQTYDESFRVNGYVQSTQIRLTDTYDILTTTPTSVGQIVFDSNYDLYVSCGTGDLTGWLKVGAQ